MLSFAQLFLAAASVSVTSPAAPLVFSADTARSADAFAHCLISARTAENRPAWFVPRHDGGGRISNSGAAGAAGVYEIRHGPSGGSQRIELVAEGGDQAWRQSLIESIRSCS